MKRVLVVPWSMLRRTVGHVLALRLMAVSRSRRASARARRSRRCDRGRAGVLVPGAALAEVARAALAGDAAGSWPACPPRPRRPRARSASAKAAPPASAPAAPRGRDQRVHHRLVARLGLAARRMPVDAGLERRRQPGGVSSGSPAGAAPSCRNSGAVQRAARRRRRVEISVIADRLQHGAGCRPARPRRASARRPQAAVHVDAVVGVADGRVELGQLVAWLLGDRRREAADPAPRPRRRDGRSVVIAASLTRPSAGRRCAPARPTARSARRRAAAA